MSKCCCGFSNRTEYTEKFMIEDVMLAGIIDSDLSREADITKLVQCRTVNDTISRT